jgi:hypothetical protein
MRAAYASDTNPSGSLIFTSRRRCDTIREPKGSDPPMKDSPVLFYPTDSYDSGSNLASKIALFPIIVCLLLFAIFAPVVLILIPVACFSAFYKKTSLFPPADQTLATERIQKARRELRKLAKKQST